MTSPASRWTGGTIGGQDGQGRSFIFWYSSGRLSTVIDGPGGFQPPPGLGIGFRDPRAANRLKACAWMERETAAVAKKSLPFDPDWRRDQATPGKNRHHGRGRVCKHIPPPPRAVQAEIRKGLQDRNTPCKPSGLLWRRQPDSNWRITALQAAALPLGYAATKKNGAGNGI